MTPANNLYYYRDFPFQTPQVGKNFKTSLRLLDFFDYIFHKRRDILNRKGGAEQSELARAADYAAACVAQLHQSDWLKTEAIGQALEHSHDLIEGSGYRITSLREFHQEMNGNTNYVILVPGCQTRKLYESRVRALVNVIRRVPFRSTIVFSGRSPSKAKTAKTLDEARSMNNYFEEQIDSSREFDQHRRMVVYLDEESGSTEENIRKFLGTSGVLLADQANEVMLVTSLFHMPRLARELELYINRQELKNIARVALVCSENLEPGLVSTDKDYLKSMFFEVFNDLLLNRRGRPHHRHTWPEIVTPSTDVCGYGLRRCTECDAEDTYQYGKHDWSGDGSPNGFYDAVAVQLCQCCGLVVKAVYAVPPETKKLGIVI